jgi:muramoyltetrapeptide carboxypeptidase
MPATFDSLVQDPPTWESLLAFVRGQRPPNPWGLRPLHFLTDPPPAPIEADLIGGNLTLWSSLAGTRHGPAPATGQLLFFEEVREELYRIDRQVTQLDQAGLLDGAAGIILGDFTHCDDTVRSVRSSTTDPNLKAPLRPAYTLDAGLHEIFVPVARRLNIPLAVGLPVGHGPHFAPLPLHARYRVSVDGTFELLRWEWKKIQPQMDTDKHG